MSAVWLDLVVPCMSLITGSNLGKITSVYQYSEALFIRDAFIRKHRYPDGFSRQRKNAT